MESRSNSADTEAVLARLFAVYAAERANGVATLLTLSKYRQMARDCGLLDGQFTPQTVELVFCSCTRHKPRMPLSTFLESIPRLAAAKWPESSPHESTVRIINEHLLPLYVRLCGSDQPLDVKEADPEVRVILRQVFPMLREIYVAYFAWEVSGASNEAQVTQRSQTAFFECLRAFDICPQLVSKPEVAGLWRELLGEKETLRPFAGQLLPTLADDLGKVFTLGLFLTSLYLLTAAVGPRDSKRDQALEFLERMEVSQGFASLKMRTHTPRTEASYLVPPRPASAVVRSSVGPRQSVSARAAPGDQQQERLLTVFKRYSAYGDQMNTGRIGSSQFVKLFRDCQLVAPGDLELFKSDLDVIYSKLTGKAALGRFSKMDFQTFLRALEIVAGKLFPQQNSEQAYAVLVEDYILRLDSQPDSDFIRRLADLLQDSEVLDALGTVHSSIVYYYHSFADPHGLLTYASFMKFCMMFAVFPDLCTKPKLFGLFNALAGLFSAQNEGAEGVIDEHLFVEALALVALEMNLSTDPPPVHRLCLLVEKMSQSGGPARVMQSLGHGRTNTETQDLLAKLRAQYPNYLAPRAISQPSLKDLLGSKT